MSEGIERPLHGGAENATQSEGSPLPLEAILGSQLPEPTVSCQNQQSAARITVIGISRSWWPMETPGSS
ncbi:hypothetical protein DUNSADRAFT_15218 [Dunaliella salina]|uniref:Encoded protein n=1 Tax=Dunaliella salina TaxID=3046 RepID=A0ABQ7H217_DUNSA|nr:hypothetical protein DUNSADRAFT_15218 [Dunaliella salina]|eukprot:KAF5840850.1 hypothetical protein DUNSADRAFT_15218 [Dunaliella salina]